MGAGSSSASSAYSYKYSQPICEGEMPKGYPDLLLANMWDNAVNALTNFCAGTPFFNPPALGRFGTLGPHIPHWTPLCRCKQKFYATQSMRNAVGPPRLKCYRRTQRIELAEHCRGNCRCVGFGEAEFQQRQLDASGKVANLPPDMQKLVPQPAKSLFNCFGSCVAPQQCRTNSLDGNCGQQICIAQPGIDALSYAGGTCIALTSIAVSVKKHKRPGKMPRKRSLAPQCYCNATYVSEGCCESLDGIVWEDVVNGLRLELRSPSDSWLGIEDP